MNALAQIPALVTPEARPVTLGAYADIVRAAGPIAIERDHMTRVTEVYMATEGRDVGSASDELAQKLAADPRTQRPEVALGRRDGPDEDDVRRARRRRSASR